MFELYVVLTFGFLVTMPWIQRQGNVWHCVVSGLIIAAMCVFNCFLSSKSEITLDRVTMATYLVFLFLSTIILLLNPAKSWAFRAPLYIAISLQLIAMAVILGG